MKRRTETEKTLSVILKDLAATLPPEGLSLRQLLDRLRDRGFLMLCIVLVMPFLLPVSIPGTSTPFGLAIALIGLSMVLNKEPRFPGRIMNRPLAARNLALILKKGSGFFAKMERWMRPRLQFLSQGETMIRFNGFLITLSALLLTLPLPLPFSNTIPAYSVLFLAAGSLERDGYMLLAGYFMLVLAIFYIGGLALAGSFGLSSFMNFLITY